MVRDSFKVPDAVEHNGQVVAVLLIQILLAQFHQIGSEGILIAVHMVLQGHHLFRFHLIISVNE